MPKHTTPGAGNPTAKQINDIVAASQGGNPLPLICKATKLKLETVEDWLQRGREAKPGTDLHTFAADYDAAAALAEISLRKSLNDHAKTSPEAAFKLLELQAKDREAPPEASRPLANPLHEALCQLMATHGMKAGPAWRKLTGCNPKSAKANASRALTNATLKSRLVALQTAKHQSNVLTKEDRLRVSYEVVNSATATHADRLRAARQDAELKGELIGKTELTGQDGAPLPSIIPAIIIQAPRASGRRAG
jgi:hypothetical protein